MFWKRRDDLFRVTTNLILFCETGVLDRELNLTSIPYMGSPEGLRHCCCSVVVVLVVVELLLNGGIQSSVDVEV